MWREGDVIDGTYQIVRELGSGGTGVIYLAYHLRLMKYVVLKKIKDGFTDIMKVRNEVDILKGLRHECLPQVYDFMQVGGSIYTVIDYIEGYDFEQYIKSGYCFHEEQIISYLRQMCDVLGYLHSRKPKILHCDIKPSNILLDSSGRVCLIDFNVSVDGDKGEMTGISANFASPEQYAKALDILYYGGASGVVIDERTDIYSLGATFFFVMTGVLPDVANGVFPSFKGLRTGYSKELVEIIEKMVAYDPESRFSSAREVTRAIDRIYKRESAGKKRAVVIIASFLIYSAAVIAGAVLMVRGTHLKQSEAFLTKMESVVGLYDSCDYESTIQSATELLNSSKYTEFVSEGSENRGVLLKMIGESCFESGRYESAAEYFRDYCENTRDPDKSAFCDMVISYVRAGNLDEAEKLAAEAQENGMSSDRLSLIECEIRNEKGDLSGLNEKIDRLCNFTTDLEVKNRACVLGVLVAGATGDYDSQIRYCNMALSVKESSTVYRMLGDAYINRAGTYSSNDSRFTGDNTLALEAYDKVLRSGFYYVEDVVNYSLAALKAGEFSKALDRLIEAEKDHVNDYRIYMCLAFVYDAAGDGDKASSNCKEAVRLYENTPGEKESRLSDNLQSLYALSEKYS